MNDEQNRFSHEVKLFFQSYLPNIKGLSPNTMLSYRDTLKFYFHFLAHIFKNQEISLFYNMLIINAISGDT